jgi:phage tail-like protein
VRGAIEGLVSPVPLLQRLPGVLQDDEFIQRLVGAFDDGFAPVITTLDGLAAYVDPWLAPEDFLDWLAGWVGVEMDDAWTTTQRRAVVAGAALVHRRRGTAGGIADALRLAFDGEVEVTDSGACTWSDTPGTTPPGTAPPTIAVRIFVSDPSAVDVRRVEAVIESVKPAHVSHAFELLPRPAGRGRE